MSTARCHNGRIQPRLYPGLEWILALLLLCVLVGCGGHPKNVLIPVADSAPNSTKVDMLVTTTRSRSTIRGEMFTGERALAPAFADITVSIPLQTSERSAKSPGRRGFHPIPQPISQP
ncbi:hypothetical protein DLJ82_1026 [Rhizobium leguminosarum]|uniref:Uncharacterized protein n=1 Tax=Rhizobium leguminosarum TaxID=384 RepID=A0A2Z4YDM6_RHILE|nr:hypothetical protein DLJ82_1026 [Rhizobium leguminosarum]